MGGVRNGAAREDGHWDLNLGPAAIERRDHAASKSGEDHKVLGEKEETTRLQSKWGGDHAALKEGEPRGSEASR